jgi:hypothetical protein
LLGSKRLELIIDDNLRKYKQDLAKKDEKLTQSESEKFIAVNKLKANEAEML